MFKNKVFILLILVFTTAANADGELVIVSSNVASLPTAQRMNSGQSIVLATDEQITLIDASGDEITLSGPYRGQLKTVTSESADTTWFEDLINLFGRQQNKKTATFRSFEKQRTDLRRNLIDIRSQGAICIDHGQPIGLWRADNDTELQGSIGIINGPTVELFWSESDQTTPWPRLIEQKNQQQYQMHMSDMAMVQQFTLIYLPETFASPWHRVAWMASQGCDAQAIDLQQANATE